MIETFLMTVSIVVLGYAFYISSRLFWTFKSEKSLWRLMYGMVSIFTILAFFLFAMMLFSFITTFLISQSILNILNVVVGVFFLSSSCLIGAVMKYHVSVVSRAEEKSLKADLEMKEVSRERTRLQKEIEGLKKELDEAKILNRVAVGRELKIIELKKKIERIK